MNQETAQLLQQIGIEKSDLSWTTQVVLILAILLVSYLTTLIFRHLIMPAVRKITARTKATWDDYLFNDKMMKASCRMIPPITWYILLPFAFDDKSAYLLQILLKICLIYLIITALMLIKCFLDSLYEISSEHEALKNRPLKGIYQMINLISIGVGIILIISVLIDRNATAILTGLGASAAILMLIFKDSILGLVAGVQLSANDMLKVGDWIEMPKYGANGTVIEVTLNTVKVRNWDNTITTIPPYLLVSDSFQNWRGMRESGGRRVKRSINIDMTSVRFCTPEMLAKYRKIQLLKDYVEQTEEVIEKYNVENGIDNSILVNGRRQTNLGVFRAYLTAYLKSLPDVNQELTCMVRQLQPTDRGIPIELYFFCALKDWVPYEGVQADVFDHVLAIIPEFDLQVFQSPSGRDFQRVLPAASEEKGA